jgi:hypothetical protein
MDMQKSRSMNGGILNFGLGGNGMSEVKEMIMVGNEKILVVLENAFKVVHYSCNEKVRNV